MIYFHRIVSYIKLLKGFNPDIKVYVYTAEIRNTYNTIALLKECDGITLTLHEENDKIAFRKLNDILLECPELVEGKSLRLNIFKEVGDIEDSLFLWTVKPDMAWIKNCPVPSDEDFMRSLFIK